MLDEILKNCVIDGFIIRLPDYPLNRKTYLTVESALNLIGGVWKGGKVSGFIFQKDPQELLSRLTQLISDSK